MEIAAYLRDNVPFKKVSLANRQVILNMIKDRLGAFSATAPVAPVLPRAREDDSTRKREKVQNDERKKESKVAPQGPKAVNKLADALKMEVRYFDRNSSLNAIRSFQEVIDLDGRSKTMEEEHNKKGQKQKRTKPLGSPIIIVPPNETAVLNMFNVKSFLEDMVYVSVEEIKKKNPNEAKQEVIYVTRRKHPQAGDIRFKVVDSIVNFDDATWERVVAVIVSGQAWQLKGWKWNTPAEIFAHVKGLYVYFDDAKISDQVKGWNVAALPIKHQSRNKDIMQVHEIWRQIDLHLERNFPQLLQNLKDEQETRIRAEKEARQKGMQALLDDEEEEDEEEEENGVLPSQESSMLVA